ncbi:photosystem II S4 domain protein [Cyanobium sp. N5-Cardenillas]|uniref:photosystem II S4 domain protein n=1 Tax=Cyanobium sp. N5-Cardenillas TaxID=2823720 RepID=UPI0020CFB725|nr:photosystem II S4 domain protein [Cyanobium sp. N5-Cardenillas]MCP9785317.1 photosystem II S4 domain protein [Cyanobium sp. N5-Cardenillas]
MLPRRDLLAGSLRPEALEGLLNLAETALRTWEPQVSGFLDAAVWEEAEVRLAALSELSLASDGGHPGAERRCLLLGRAGQEPVSPDLMGLEISGNFLFDPATAADMLEGLARSGANAAAWGDLWLRGDRGAQAIVTAALAARLDGGEGLVRTVPVRFEARPIDRLQLPARRLPRQLTTVEASLRLDALASAGFGLSRNRMANLIRQGAVRIDWTVVSSPSQPLAVGSRVQLEGRGELEVLAIDPTKRERFRIRMERH